MPNAIHVEPIVGHDFAASDFLRDAIDQNLGAAAGQTAESGRLQPREHCLRSGSLIILGEVMNLRRAEAVDVDLREVGS